MYLEKILEPGNSVLPLTTKEADQISKSSEIISARLAEVLEMYEQVYK